MARNPTYEELELKVKELKKEAVLRKQAEDALRLFSHSVDSSIDGIAMGNTENRITYVNETFDRMFGYSREELVGKEIAFIYAENQITKLEEALKATMESGWIGELIGKKKDGELFPISVSSSRVVGDEGNVIAHMASHRDITERKRAEEEQRESEAQKKAILDASVDRIRLVDTDMRMIWANKTTTRELNIAPEDLVGQPCYKIFFDRDAPCAGCPSKKAVTSGNIEHTIMHHQYSKGIEGETYWDNYSVPIKNESGDTVNLIQIARNITEQVLRKQALQESEKKYRTLFEQSRDAIYITKREGEFVDVNQSFLDLFDYTREEITEMKAQEVYIDPDDRSKFKKQVEQRGSVRDFEGKLHKKDGAEMDCLITATLRQADDGSILGYQGIVRDITESKQSEQALREREKELKIKTMSLEEVNIALRVLLKRRDEDKIELEEKVLSNVKNLVVPFVGKMKEQLKDERIKAYLNVLETNLNAIISPFSQKMSSKYLNLTTAEIEVANLVKLGKSTKEIAAMLSLSHKTIETHRVNVRKKLGITNKRANLRTYLSSID
jgi:PAS domain S-box-containing protein